MYAGSVFKGDYRKMVHGLDAIFEHIPKFETEELEGVYFQWSLNGSKYFEYKPVKWIESLRVRNKDQQGGAKGAWATDYATMGIAKIIKYCRRFMSLSDIMNEAIESDEAIVTAKVDEKGKVELKKEQLYDDAEIENEVLSEEKKNQILDIEDKVKILDFPQRANFLFENKAWHTDKHIVEVFAKLCESKSEVTQIAQELKKTPYTVAVYEILLSYHKKMTA
jgi:recombinational DNA repair protein RecT